jgi:hypothetical protein
MLCPSNHFIRPSAPPYYLSMDALSLKSLHQAFSASILFKYGLLSPLNLYFGLSMLSSHLSRNMVAINRFGCRMLNTKVRPQLATLDGLVFVSSVLCRENFHAYGMKKCTNGRIGRLAITGIRLDKSNAA